MPALTKASSPKRSSRFFQKEVLSYSTVVTLLDMPRHVITDSVIFSSDGSGIAREQNDSEAVGNIEA